MKEDRRSAPLFPISIVMDLTQLSARQIRYYEEHNLVSPTRTKGIVGYFHLTMQISCQRLKIYQIKA